MPCRTWLPFALLALVTLRAIDLWQANDLDPFSLALVPVGAALVIWLVRQPGCDGAACAVPDTATAASTPDGAAAGEPGSGAAGEPAGADPAAAEPVAWVEATADAPDPDGAARR